jgi:hypothetical protein
MLGVRLGKVLGMMLPVRFRLPSSRVLGDNKGRAVMSQSNDNEVRALHPLESPLQQCPACGSGHLDPVVETDTVEVHFLCRECKRCWHVELGSVHRMSPYVCHGCPHLGQCRPVFDTDHRGTSGSVS